MEATARRICELRKSSGLSQAKLAKIMGYGPAAMSRYENDAASIPEEVFIKYADYFNVSLDYIFGRTDNPEGGKVKYTPGMINDRFKKQADWEEFIEACFDPRSPMNAKLKEMLLSMTEGETRAKGRKKSDS